MRLRGRGHEQREPTRGDALRAIRGIRRSNRRNEPHEPIGESRNDLWYAMQLPTGQT